MRPLTEKICNQLLLSSRSTGVSTAGDPKKFGYTTEVVQYPSQPGELFSSIRIYDPKVAPSKGTLLHFRAGTMSTVLSDQWTYLQPLVAEGYEIIELGYEKKYSTLDTFTTGLAQLVEAVLRHYPTHRFIAYGQSMGGFFLTKTLAKIPAPASRFERVILESSIVNIRDVAISMRSRQKRVFARFLFSFTPYISDHWQVTQNEIDAIRCPLLVIGATQDGVIPYTQSQQLGAMSGDRFEHFAIQSTDHLFGAEDPLVKTKILNFLR